MEARKRKAVLGPEPGPPVGKRTGGVSVPPRRDALPVGPSNQLLATHVSDFQPDLTRSHHLQVNPTTHTLRHQGPATDNGRRTTDKPIKVNQSKSNLDAWSFAFSDGGISAKCALRAGLTARPCATSSIQIIANQQSPTKSNRRKFMRSSFDPISRKR